MPNGVAFHKGALYVAEIGRILRFDNIESNLNNPPEPVVVTTKLPKEKAHGWRFISFGPDDKLYIGIGAPCNVCLMEDTRYATIMRMNADGQDLEIYAKGIRNTVGFDWDPVHHNLWFTDNGRDWLGDDLPPDELNVAPRKGMDFGFLIAMVKAQQILFMAKHILVPSLLLRFLNSQHMLLLLVCHFIQVNCSLPIIGDKFLLVSTAPGIVVIR